MSEAPGHRGFYLRRALWQAGGKSPAGSYSPITNVRMLHLGEDHASPIARMVVHHEQFHAMLNSSTTFGIAMMIAGALDQADEPDMTALVERMIESSVETHETFATLSGIFVANNGAYDRSLLDGYPDYLRYFDTIADLLDLANEPFLCSICIEAVAGVAMQTDILERWNAAPCSEWSRTRWDDADAPDHRFAAIMTPSAISMAMGALRRAAGSGSTAVRTLAQANPGPDEFIAAIAALVPAEHDALGRVAFETLAEHCFPDGPRRPRWKVHRGLATVAAQKVHDYAGPRLKVRIRIADDLETEYKTAFIEARRERLVVSSSKLPAILQMDAGPPDIWPSWFVARIPGQGAHRQLVAMPYAKLSALYQLQVQESSDGRPVPEVVTAFRLYVDIPTPAFPDGYIYMMALASPDALPDARTDTEPTDLLTLISASVTLDENWNSGWSEPLERRGARIVVVIDVDPFEYVQTFAQRWPVVMVQLRIRPAEAGTPENICVIVFAQPGNPNLVMLAPCSEAFAAGFARTVRHEPCNINPDGDLSEVQAALVQRAIGHLLREESRFGFNHWWRD